jgi:hypothetical protein
MKLQVFLKVHQYDFVILQLFFLNHRFRVLEPQRQCLMVRLEIASGSRWATLAFRVLHTDRPGLFLKKYYYLWSMHQQFRFFLGIYGNLPFFDQ